jgi:hypothetical protein
MFASFFKALVARFLSNPDTLLSFLDSFLADVKAAVKATATVIDDLVFVALEAILADPELREAFKAWMASVVVQKRYGDGGVPLRVAIAQDVQTARLCQQVAGRLNIDWKKLLDLLLQYLPLILPLFLDQDQDQN